MGIIKAGKVVIVLNGRFAGRKGVVVKTYDEGTPDRRFAHAIVAGIDRAPRKVTRAMPKTKVVKRSKMKPFLKYMNYNHLMPTRYQADLDLKKIVEENGMKENKPEARKQIKKVIEDRYLNQASKSEKKTQGVQYFFHKLRF